MDAVCLVLAFEHLVGLVDHFVIHLNAQCFPHVGETVEKIGVTSFEKHRYDVPPVFHGLLDKRLLPFGVLYLPVLFA